MNNNIFGRKIMNIQNAQRLIGRMRQQHKGTDLQVAIQTIDSFGSSSAMFFIFGFFSIERFFEKSSNLSLGTGLLFFAFSVTLLVFAVKLMKVRNYMTEKQIHNLEEK
jgi:hypothetical protein